MLCKVNNVCIGIMEGTNTVEKGTIRAEVIKQNIVKNGQPERSRGLILEVIALKGHELRL